MNNKNCPRCGQGKISVLQKVRLGFAKGIKCPSCGVEVVVPKVWIITSSVVIAVLSMATSHLTIQVIFGTSIPVDCCGFSHKIEGVFLLSGLVTFVVLYLLYGKLVPLIERQP